MRQSPKRRSIAAASRPGFDRSIGAALTSAPAGIEQPGIDGSPCDRPGTGSDAALLRDQAWLCTAGRLPAWPLSVAVLASYGGRCPGPARLCRSRLACRPGAGGPRRGSRPARARQGPRSGGAKAGSPVSATTTSATRNDQGDQPRPAISPLVVNRVLYHRRKVACPVVGVGRTTAGRAALLIAAGISEQHAEAGLGAEVLEPRAAA